MHLHWQEVASEGTVEEVGGVGQVPMLLVLLQVQSQLNPGPMLVLSNTDHWSFDFVRRQTQNSHLTTFTVVLWVFNSNCINLKMSFSPSRQSRGRWTFYSYKMWEESG